MFATMLVFLLFGFGMQVAASCGYNLSCTRDRITHAGPGQPVTRPAFGMQEIFKQHTLQDRLYYFIVGGVHLEPLHASSDDVTVSSW